KYEKRFTIPSKPYATKARKSRRTLKVMPSCSSCLRGKRLQTKRNEFRRMLLPANRHDNVLLTFVEIRHHRTGRAGVEIRFPHNFAGCFVKRAKLLASAIRRRPHVDLIALADKQERLRRERRRSNRLPERTEVQILEGRMISRTIAIRHHP